MAVFFHENGNKPFLFCIFIVIFLMSTVLKYGPGPKPYFSFASSNPKIQAL